MDRRIGVECLLRGEQSLRFSGGLGSAVPVRSVDKQSLDQRVRRSVVPLTDGASTRLSATGFDDNRLFRTLFAAYPDALLVVAANGAVVQANPSAAELLGYSVAELVGFGADTGVPVYAGISSLRHPTARLAETLIRKGSDDSRPLAMQTLRQHDRLTPP